MKIRSTLIRFRIPWRREADAAGDLNLLDLQPADHPLAGGGRWILFALLILLHGGMLAYLIGFARMPREARSDMPKTIRVELAARPALEKQDREMLRAEARVRAYALKAAARRLRKARPREQQPVAAIGLNLPRRLIGTLPEDLGIAREPRVSPFGARLASLESRSDGAVSREAPTRPDSGQQPSMGPDLPDSVDQSLRVLARQSGTLLPEDTGRDDPRADEAGAAELSSDVPGEMLSLSEESDVPARKTALLVPLPDRRTIVAGASGSHEQSSSDAADVAEPEGRGEVLSTYRAKVRAHLAAHKPSGGFGTDTVVVAFTLTRSGNVASARILRSRGIYHLEQGALNAVHRAAPFPKPPGEVEGSRFRFAIPFRFQ